MLEGTRGAIDAGGGRRQTSVAVVGAGRCAAETAHIAEKIGHLVARLPADLVCGGLGGVMEAAAKGARDAGGRTVGILPGISKDEANKYIDVVVPTGMGQARNLLVVLAADVVIAVGGEFGTLSEIGLALKHNIPVIGLNTWPIGRMAADRNVPFFPVDDVPSALEAVQQVLREGHTRSLKGGEGAFQ